MHQISRFFGLLFIILLALPSYAQSSSWVLKKDKNNLKVYTRSVEGSSIKELKLETKMKGTMSSVLAAFYDVDTYKVWAYSTLETKIVKEISDLEMYYYSVSDFPWPFSDRDIVVRSVISQDPVTKRVVSKSTSAMGIHPEQKNRVRVPTFDAVWAMEPAEESGYINVEYFISTDPGGNIPAMLVNLFIDKGPTASIERLQKVIEQEPYRSATYTFIEE